ncbi:hypothetical protein JRG66_05705 [Salinimicrobium tongyeongense]|uniref:T9SS C-terminal target domain-containing protein n=1 Tax=Salinimicrobium tongyeongense TaxID=2809707 RepID=A0ABY6NTW7_9FLAO|nr:hypothetical protein [Salinimicrobium tongyeongense]UZH56357.1 hypothetical protein JRG66_05705 [Salinimicrobium tongyeongense]
MKNHFLKTVFTLVLSAVFFSCSSDDDVPNPDPGTGGDTGVLEGSVLEGDITDDLLVKEGNYNLKGAVSVKDGATLTIEPGTTFTVSAADQAAGVNLLFVEQGGKLIAEGTAAKPIVFTSENKNSEGGDGDWGGIGIHGRAKMNAPGGTSISEAGQLPYGGTNDEDSSGSLKFVRVEYAGQASSDGQFEFNAFSFFAVGSGTVLENLEAFEGADDGFEFYGGTVNAKNLVAIGMEDDSVDWDEGYRGTLTNLAIVQYDGVGDFAFELANRKGENNAEPRSMGTVKNVSILGHNRSGKAAFDLKQGTGGIFQNIVATNYETIIFLNDQLQEVENDQLQFTGSHFEYSESLLVNNVDETNVAGDLLELDENATGADLSAFKNWSNLDPAQEF